MIHVLSIDDLVEAYRRQIAENRFPSFTGDDIEYQRMYAIRDVLEHCHILNGMKFESNDHIPTYEQF